MSLLMTVLYKCRINIYFYKYRIQKFLVHAEDAEENAMVAESSLSIKLRPPRNLCVLRVKFK